MFIYICLLSLTKETNQEMKNTTKIIRSLLEKASIEIDMGIASTEVKDSKFYLYATLELDGAKDYYFASRPTAENLELIELTEDQEYLITQHLKEAGDTEAQYRGFNSWKEMEAYREKQEFITPTSIYNLY